MNTKEIDGRTYTMQPNADGSITLVPVPEPEKERERRCGDVWIDDHSFCVRDGQGNRVFTTIFGCFIKPFHPAGGDDSKYFNLFDVAAAFPDGIPDPSELVRKSDVVAALDKLSYRIQYQFICCSYSDRPHGSTVEAISNEIRGTLAALGITPKEEQK